MSSDKNVDPESEYFARIGREQKAKLAEELTAEKTRAEREAARKVHHMRCGKCGGHLVIQAFRGVDIDVCSTCGSVLLDPGELKQLAGKDASGVLASLSKFFTGKIAPE